MKLNRQRLRWLVPLFIILIGGSIFSLASGFLLRGYDPEIQNQSIKPASSPTSFSYTISIQAHAITPKAGHSSGSTPTSKPTNQPAPTGTTPTGINYTTLPPGRALPGDSTCASNVTRRKSRVINARRRCSSRSRLIGWLGSRRTTGRVARFRCDCVGLYRDRIGKRSWATRRLDTLILNLWIITTE